jgi:electron transfer DM13
MSGKKAIIIGIIIAAVAIPLGIYTASPLFINTEINEPVPTLKNGNNDAAAMQEFKDFMEMSEEERIEKGQQMSIEERDMIMKGAAQTNGTSVNEEMTTIGEEETSTVYAGTFVGVNDGIHNAEGQAKVIKLSDGSNFLRLEDFRSTNGPDLYVYLSTDKSNSDFVNLGKLKGNVGNQNYEIQQGIDLSKYDTVLIWCQAFSVLFGSAELRNQ